MAGSTSWSAQWACFQHLPLDNLDLAAWHRMWAIDSEGPLRLCVRALSALTACGSGRFVNIASVSTCRARSGFGPGTMSKHTVAGLTNSGFTIEHALVVDGGFLAKYPERLADLE